MAEYKANMNALGQRLQKVEELAEEKQETMIDDGHKRKNSLNLIGIGSSEDNV
jgi:hypothetical protein